MKVPEELRYTKEHEWVKLSGDVATLGITEFAQNELGEIVFADLPQLGKQIKKGESACVVESTKAASDVYAPVSGKVKEVNEALRQSPELVNSDSYGTGWMVKLEGVQKAELDGLLSAEDYRKHIGL